MALPKIDNWAGGVAGTPLPAYNPGYVNTSNVTGGLEISSVGPGLVDRIAGGDFGFAIWNGDTFTPAQYAQVIWDASMTNGIGGVIARWTMGAAGADSGYWASGNFGDDQVHFLRRDNGVDGLNLQLPNGPGLHGADVLRLETIQTTIRILINSVLKGAFTDTTYSAGHAGLNQASTGGPSALGAWEGGNLTGSPGDLPYTEHWTGPAGTHVQSYQVDGRATGWWSENDPQDLIITTPNGGVQGASGTSYCTSCWLGNPFNADQFAQVTFGNNGQAFPTGGPIVRAGGGLDPNGVKFYMLDCNDSGGTNSYIFLRNGGGFSLLLTLNTTFAFGDTAKIVVAGTTITAYKNGTLIGTVTDLTLSSGLGGIMTLGTLPVVGPLVMGNGSGPAPAVPKGALGLLGVG